MRRRRGGDDDEEDWAALRSFSMENLTHAAVCSCSVEGQMGGGGTGSHDRHEERSGQGVAARRSLRWVGARWHGTRQRVWRAGAWRQGVPSADLQAEG